ncbi:MAG: nucleotide exchange factor GrpE [Clostridia bacterium]|nr:nucleotide exchange factor GrpE [Clostridia bacterium]
MSDEIKDTVTEEAEAAEVITEEVPEGGAEDVRTGKKEDKKEEKKFKSKCATLERELEKIKGALDEAKDSHLRVAAEYENFRKRTQKEKESIYSDAVSDTVRELLPLFDDLDRAAAYMDGDNVGEGLALILKTVPDVLAKLKIEPFGESGDTFDPNLHEAIMHEESEEYGESEIVEVFRKGYKKGDKIIRHALVKVAN